MTKSIYPSIPAPGNDLSSMQAAVGAMRQTLTMLILNAQNPNPSFTPSSSAQVFVTLDQLQKLGKVGPTGQQGPPGEQGPAGPPGAGGIPEAPDNANTYGRHMSGWVAVTPEASNDANTYGRSALAWQPVLTATSPVFATLPVNAVNDAAAATAGVPVNGVYRNGSVLMVRVV